MNTRIFPRLSTAILTKDFTQALPTSNVTPTTKPSSDSTPRATYRKIFSRLSTAIFTYSGSGGALPPTSPLRQHHIRIPLLTLPTQHFFPPLYHQFKIFLKRWSLTSNVNTTPTSDSDSPPRLTHPSIFSRLSTSIFTLHQAVEPYLQRHPYTTTSMPSIR